MQEGRSDLCSEALTKSQIYNVPHEGTQTSDKANCSTLCENLCLKKENPSLIPENIEEIKAKAFIS